MDKKKNLSGSQWTIEEASMLYHLRSTGKTNVEVAELMNKMEQFNNREYTEDSVRKKFNSTNWKEFFKLKEEYERNLNSTETLEDEKRDIIDKTLGNQEKLLKKDFTRTQIVIDNLKSSIYRLPKPKSSELLYKPTKDSKYRSEHVGIILSDVHVGECHSYEETGGLSEYNVDVFKQRAESFKDKVLDITDRHRHMYDLPELHIFSLGDMVAGMNEAGQWSYEYLDLNIYEQVMQAFSTFRNIIATWAKHFKKVNFYGIFGNHGRVGKRGIEKVFVNWDRICYDFLQTSLSEYDNIEWHIPKSWWLMPKILNYNFYLCHGDGIKSSMGIPFYGVERAERNIVSMLKNEKIDYFLLGHFHSPAELQTNNGRILMNGSWMGGDMFSIRDLRRMDRPEQKMFGIHEKRGITWMYNIDLASEG